MTEEKTSRNLSVLQSMLDKLKSNEKIHSSSQQISKFYTYTNETDQNEAEDTAVSPKLEPTFEKEDNSDTAVNPGSLESTVKNAAHEDSETFPLELYKSSPEFSFKSERRKHASYNVVKGVEEDLQSSKSQHEVGKLREESGPKEETSGTFSPSNLSQSNKRLVSEATEPSNNDIHTSKQSLHTISSKALENPNNKATRSASDPVKIITRSDRTLSDPSRHYNADTDKLITLLGQASGTPGTTECDGSKVKKDKKKKNIAQKLKAKFKEKSSHEKSSSSSGHHGDEDTTLSDISIEETESPTEENFTTIKLMLQRTCTLRDFRLNLEPINLMDELFTGEEWIKFLPVKESLLQGETSDQSQTESFCQTNDVQPDNSVIIQDHQPSTDRDQSQSETDPTSVNDRALDEVRELRPRQMPSKPIFAVPKALITNGAVKQKKCELPEYEHSTDDDVYDFVAVYMLPKNNPKVKELPSDLPEIKSMGILNNSALKSRINLSKKRMHRPPKKRRKETSDTRRTSTFYISSVETSTNVDDPRIQSYSTSSYSPPHKSVNTSHSSSYNSSVFYALPKPMSSCDPDVSLAPADEKKAKEKPEKPKLWKLKN